MVSCRWQRVFDQHAQATVALLRPTAALRMANLPGMRVSFSMSFLAVLLALIIEQARPLARGNWIHAGFRALARWAARNLDAGQSHHGWIAWTVAVGLPSAVTVLTHFALWTVSPLMAFVWSVGILYITLGFRQFSHHFTGIRDALEDGDEDSAREQLANWQQVNAGELPRSEIIRHVIEYSVLAAHRHVFGVLGWFSILAALGLGPAGAVMYRMSEFVGRYWVHKSKTLSAAGEGASPALQHAATQAWGVIDFLPARVTALGFAVVGSFEDAIDAWRNYTQRLGDQSADGVANRNDGIVLAATSGAINVRLGGQALQATLDSINSSGVLEGGGSSEMSALPTPGREPDLAHLRSVVGLVWRSVVLWMVLLALLTLAKLLG